MAHLNVATADKRVDAQAEHAGQAIDWMGADALASGAICMRVSHSGLMHCTECTELDPHSYGRPPVHPLTQSLTDCLDQLFQLDH